MFTKNFHNKIINGDSLKELKKIPDETFDLIFADPPYEGGDVEFQMIRSRIKTRKLLRPGGWLIFEHTDELDFSSDEAFIEARKYGSSVFSFFRFKT